MTSRRACPHPEAQRWQWNGWWQCCLCLKAFWGLKSGPDTCLWEGLSIQG